MHFVVGVLEKQFSTLLDELAGFARNSSEILLFGSNEIDQPANLPKPGTLIVRAAGCIEQVFGGLSRRLWDDPFEWTLPESLDSKQKILDYLEEVGQRQAEGFSLFKGDSDLEKMVPAPIDLQPILDVLLSALTRAWFYFGIAKTIANKQNFTPGSSI